MATFLDIHAGTHTKEGDYAKITADRKRDISVVLLAVIDVLDRICNNDIGPAPALPASADDYKAAFIKAMGVDRPTRVVEFMTNHISQGKMLSIKDDRDQFNELLRVVGQDMAVELLRDWPDQAQGLLLTLSRQAFINFMMQSPKA